MSAATRARRERARPFLDPPGYARHRPEATLLYQLVERHYPTFREMRAEAGRPLPDYFHMLFLDGVYTIDEAGQAVFRHVPELCPQDLQILVEHIAERIGGALEKQGLIGRDIENVWLFGDGEGGPLDDLLGHSIT